MTTLASTPSKADGFASGASNVDSLALHLHDCFKAQGAVFGLQLFGESLHGWMAPRFCTTLVFVTGVLLLLGVFA